MSSPVRLCEWGRTHCPQVEQRVREAVDRAAKAWQVAHNLNAAPLHWTGNDGKTLVARQWCGVVEVEGLIIEIYPKLDKSVLDLESPDEGHTGSLLRGLLWLLDKGHYFDTVETETAELKRGELLEFPDLWSTLLGQNLRREFDAGLARAYMPHEDNLRGVRGKILVGRQVSHNWGRMDRIASAWDDFTADTALNRLLKAACRFLCARTTHPAPHGVLTDCLFALDDVQDVSPESALRDVRHFTFHRGTERFRHAFNLSRLILEGHGPSLGAGEDRTWVFLVDMNKVFEKYVAEVLRARWNAPIDQQMDLGKLLHLDRGGVRQKADFVWTATGHAYIGDAKYKLLRDPKTALASTEEDEESAPVSNKNPALSPNDIRQLTVYAELWHLKHPSKLRPSLALLYPYVGSGPFEVETCTAWNGSRFSLVPVKVTRVSDLKKAVPGDWESVDGTIPVVS